MPGAGSGLERWSQARGGARAKAREPERHAGGAEWGRVPESAGGAGAEGRGGGCVLEGAGPGLRTPRPPSPERPSGSSRSLRVSHLRAVGLPGEGGEDAPKNSALLGILHLVAVKVVELGASAAEHQSHGGGLQACEQHGWLGSVLSPGRSPSDTSRWLASPRRTARAFRIATTTHGRLASRRVQDALGDPV